MGKNLKQDLLETISQTYPPLFERLEDIDLERVIYPESGWRGRELLSHMAAWNLAVVTALDHFLEGKDYLIPDFEEDQFNQRTAVEHQDLPADEVRAFWKHSIVKVTFAIEKIPEELFPGELLYPWGEERGSIPHLVSYFIEHDVDHIQEIVNNS